MNKKQTSQPTVLILSGGLDSYVLAHELTKDGAPFRGLYVDFGKPVNEREIATVKRLSLELRFPIDVVNASGLSSMQRGYVPDSHIMRDELDIKEYEDIVESQPYTSGFQILLGIGSYYSQIVGSNSMVMGAIKDQLTVRPDLPNVFSKMEEIVSILNPSRPAFSIQAPYSTKSKAEVVETGSTLGATLERSWSCLLAGKIHCGVCAQCKSRKQAFKKAKVKDKTTYGK